MYIKIWYTIYIKIVKIFFGKICFVGSLCHFKHVVKYFSKILFEKYFSRVLRSILQTTYQNAIIQPPGGASDDAEYNSASISWFKIIDRLDGRRDMIISLVKKEKINKNQVRIQVRIQLRIQVRMQIFTFCSNTAFQRPGPVSHDSSCQTKKSLKMVDFG